MRYMQYCSFSVTFRLQNAKNGEKLSEKTDFDSREGDGMKKV